MNPYTLYDIIQPTMRLKPTKQLWIILSLLLAGAILMSLPQPAAANQLAQAAYLTPTAGSDGRILYIVKSGETCLSISLLTGVSLDQLRKLNNLKADCVIYPGQKLLIGLGGPAQVSPTPGPSPTATSLLPTPTPFNGVGQLCMMLYNDINGDAMRQDTEPAIGESAISVSNLSGKVSLTGVTASGDTPTCFTDIPEGDYNVSVAAPQGYNATTVMNSSIHILAGDQATLEFGVQISAKAVPAQVSEGGRSPMLGFIGGAVILVGLGLGIFVLRMRKGSTVD
jgi:hypothetical protein